MLFAPKTEIQKMLQAYPNLEGAKALSILLFHSGQEIDCIKLNFMANPPDFSQIQRMIQDILGEQSLPSAKTNLPNPFNCLSPIMLCDRKTIRDVYKRLNQLIAIKASILCAPLPYPAKLQSTEEEICALKKYLGEVLRPGGKIRCLQPEEKRASQRISVAIRRFLQKAEKEYPLAVRIIRQNLSMGNSFRLEEME